MDIFKQISDSLNQGEAEKAAEFTEQAIAQKIAAKTILDQGLIAGMNIIAKKFKEHQVFLPEVLLAARAMHAGLEKLKPLLIREGVPIKGKVVLGTVQGDLHDIGKNLVGILLQGAGYEVIDIGHDAPPARFVETAKKEGAGVIAMSALLTTTMPMMKQAIALLREDNPGGSIKTLIGGAPVSQEYAEKIGADAYGFDGTSAVECVAGLTEGGKK
ncbi:MAG: corrinoid protein [Candidatus Aminicenantes bacterium]|nr:corrinoid protein [Candidatus Aminicenantes bacterium]